MPGEMYTSVQKKAGMSPKFFCNSYSDHGSGSCVGASPPRGQEEGGVRAGREGWHCSRPAPVPPPSRPTPALDIARGWVRLASASASSRAAALGRLLCHGPLVKW